MTKHPILHVGGRAVRARKVGAGGAEYSPKSPKGRAFRTSKRRVLLNAPEKIDSQGQPIHCSGFAHAVKSFNMVDAFGLLSCSAVRDFVTERMAHLHAANCNTAVVPRSTRDRGVAALASSDVLRVSQRPTMAFGGGRPARCVTTVATRKGGCRPTRGDQGATSGVEIDRGAAPARRG